MSSQMNEDNAVLFSLLTIIQYVEKLTDVELAEAIERRMELRYALHLDTPSPRLEPRSLCAFRRQIFTDPQRRSLFEEMFKTIYPEITSTAMKEDISTEDVLNSICEHEIHASIMEAMLGSMEALSANHFSWLRAIALPHWYQRYNRSLIASTCSSSLQKQEVHRDDLLGDIQHLLYEIHESNSPDIMEMHEIKNLALIWGQLMEPQSVKDCNHCVNRII
jgi:hypothetical protein